MSNIEKVNKNLPSNQLNKKQLMQMEVIKMIKDSVYFMKNYCYIQHPQKGRIKFNLYSFQEDTLKKIIKNRFNIILKARQMGISTLTAGYSLWFSMFHHDKYILIVAIKLKVAQNLLHKIRVMYDNLPNWIKNLYPLKYSNMTEMVFKNGSRIESVPMTGYSGRSSSVSLLIIDEMAFIPKIKILWTAVSPTLSTGGRAIMLSCVTDNTYVYTNKGIKMVRDFIPNDGIKGDYQIQPYNIKGMNKSREGYLFHNNGKVKTKKIITKYIELEGSYNHKLWSCKNGIYDWHEMKDLSIDDWVNVQYGMNMWGNNDDVSDFNPIYNNKHKVIFKPTKLTPNISYLLGLYLSEGNSYKLKNKKHGKIKGHQITITCENNISNIFEHIGLPYSNHDKLHYNINSYTLIQFMEYLGFNLSLKYHNKIIPSRLLEMSKKNITALLSGIFDSDGYFTKQHCICISLNNKTLINQIKYLLLNLGILSKYYKNTKKCLNEYNDKHKHFKYDMHYLEIDKSFNFIFKKEIGFKTKRKQNNLINNHQSKINKSKNVIPYSLDFVNNLYTYHKLTIYKLLKEYNLNIYNIVNKITKHKSNHISKDTIKKLINVIHTKLTDEQQDFINKTIIPNSKWVQIKDIINSKNYTYDFSLPNNKNDFWSHSILYNGVLGHQTPNGLGNLFHKTWVEAEEGTNGFIPIKLHWSLHPDRNENFAKEFIQKLGYRKFGQEYGCDFIASGNTFIETEILTKIKEVEPLEKRGYGKELWVWKYPDYTHDYILSADVARGDGSDYSAFHVIDIITSEQVAEFKGKVGTKDYAKILVAVATEYNNAVLVVENNNIGWAVLQKIIDLNYNNLYYSYKEFGAIEPEIYLEQNYDLVDKSKMKPGFTMSTKTRPLTLSSMEMYFREEDIKIYSKRLINELFVFLWINGKPQAQSGYNDDLVMSLASGLFVRDTALMLRKKGQELTRQTLNIMSNTNMANKYTKQNTIYQTNTKQTPFIYKTQYGNDMDLREWI